MPDDSDHESETGEQPPALTIAAAVIDTNFGAGGNFDSSRIRSIAARLQRDGIELWVPQQVIWEWAVHAHETWQKVRREHRKLVLGGFADDQPSETAVELVDALQARAEGAGTYVLPTHGASAIQAIRDQILGTGPGKSEKGVRTGAADSAWIRDALDHADGKIRQIVFLSGNAEDVLKTTRSMGFADIEVQIAQTEPELFEKYVATMVEGSIAVTRRVAEKLLDQAATAQREQDADFHDVHPPWFETSDLDVDSDIHERSEWADLKYREGVAIGLPQPAVLHISNVRMDVADSDEFPKHARSITFDLTLLGGILLNGFSFDESGAVGFNENYLDNVLITVPCVIEDDPASGLNDVRQTDTGTISSAVAQFDEQSEALAWTLDQLSALDHVAVQLETSPYELEDGSLFLLRGPNDHMETVRFSESSIDDSWQMDFLESGVTIECTYDPDAQAWFDGDSYDLYPAYGVHSSNSREPHSAIGQVWCYLLGIRSQTRS